MASPFTPKQAIPFSGDLLDEVQCRVTVAAATQALKHLPVCTSSSVVHDNGCGTGAVTEAIVASKPPAGIKILGTDAAPPFVATYQERIERYHWPAKSAILDCQDLKDFADGTFTHSVSAFLFMGLADDVKAAKEIRRTLDAAGTAAILVWDHAPHMSAIIEASKIVRGTDSPVPAPLAHDEYKSADLKRALTAAGFEETNIKVLQERVWMEIKDPLRWANLAWTFLGTPSSGWSQKDEDEWDAAVEAIMGQMRKVKGARAEPALAIPMIASVVIAQK